MLSYLHAFHAGNFADVQKHAALTLIISMMQIKSSGIACFDTHAGSAMYDLNSERAKKTGEANGGIQKLWLAGSDLGLEDWQPMQTLLAQLNNRSDRLSVYPGSPVWFRQFLRAKDSLTAFELHPTENHQLADWAMSRQVRVLKEDGLRGLLKCLPPRQPRLLVLIDPSYEIKSEYADVASTLEKAWNRCRHGVYLVWYPILTSGLHLGLSDAIQRSSVRKVLRSEIHLNNPPERGMTGSGVLVINPPWGFGERFSAMLTEVGGGDRLNITSTLDWLVPE
jgi:23S rRNA (adenine2030-N6)-methyltransferase